MKLNQSQSFFRLGQYSKALQVLQKLQKELTAEQSYQKLWIVEHRIAYQIRQSGETYPQEKIQALYQSAVDLFGAESRQAQAVQKWLKES